MATYQELLQAAAGFLEQSDTVLNGHAGTSSFIELGGSSLAATTYVSHCERELNHRIDLARLLGTEALEKVLRDSTPFIWAKDRRVDDSSLRALLPGQSSMLFAERLQGGSAHHLTFTLEAPGRPDRRRLRVVIDQIVAEHEALRTVFRDGGGVVQRRVLPDWRPVVVEEWLPEVADPVSTLHERIAGRSSGLLDPYRSPPVRFYLTESSCPTQRWFLTLLIHHVLVDGWAVGLLLKRLAELYGAADSRRLDVVRSEIIGTRESPRETERTERRAAQLRSVATGVTLPTDLPEPTASEPGGSRLVFSLETASAARVEDLARSCGVTRTTVLFAAWALTIARRTGLKRFTVGLTVSGRSTAELMDVVGLCSRVVPVVCEADDSGSVSDYIRGVAQELAAAVAFADVPPERLAQTLSADEVLVRNPLVPLAFSAHDELIPAEIQAGDLTIKVHEGHCGGSIFDAVLYVQRWGTLPTLALEHRFAALAPEEATGIIESFTSILAGWEEDATLSSIRGMSQRQKECAEAWGNGPESVLPKSIWQAVAAQAECTPDLPAVEDPASGVALTYAELVDAATSRSHAIAAAGVGDGDVVAIALPRSAEEIVSIVGASRLGAAYVAIDPNDPPDRLREILAITRPRAVIGDALGNILANASGKCTIVRDEVTAVASAAAPNRDRVAYLALTSGSTGQPKAVAVPERAVLRLVVAPEYVRHGPGERMLRLAPLAFDASTLEVFAPLVTGATIVVFPPGPPAPSGLSTFIRERNVSVLWLTAGLFRLVADFAPEAFSGVGQVLTGGDVVPPAQVRALLEHHPALRITNGYGPTENTTFTTVHHVDDPCEVDDAIPIGRPVPGTRIVVLDSGGGPVPPGGVGELWATGDGLARGYVADAEATAKAFQPILPDGALGYRTGDLVRFDARGRLRFLGRRDGQIKIRGFRVELDAIRNLLLAHPAVEDVFVSAVGDDRLDRRILAAVLPSLSGADLRELRIYCRSRLPKYAVPDLWTAVATLPITANGKVDLAALTRSAKPISLATAPEEPTGGIPGVTFPEVSPRPTDMASVLQRIWCEVLGAEAVGLDDRFFDLGGDSLRLARVHELMRREITGYDIELGELFAYPTVRAVTERLVPRTSK